MFTPAYIRNNNNLHFLFSQIKCPILILFLIFEISSMFEITVFAFKYNNFLRRARMNFFRYSNITFFSLYEFHTLEMIIIMINYFFKLSFQVLSFFLIFQMSSMSEIPFAS